MTDIRTRLVQTAGVAWRAIAVGIVVLSLATAAHASPILSLFSTGVFADGSVVPDGTIGDLHYSLISVPGGTTGLQARSASGFPIPPWMGSDGVSSWIGPNNNSSLEGPGGDYTFRTNFDLTGYHLETAIITVKWAMDNSAVDVLLNGISTGNAVPPSTAGVNAFETFTTFTLSSGFNQGANTLDFVINNIPGTSTTNNPLGINPIGLRVELSGTATTPEPTSFLLFGAGLVGLGLIPRKRAQAGKSK